MSDINHLGDKLYPIKFNPLLKLPVGDKVPEEINMLVETPMGSINKYEFHTQTGLIKLDRVLYEKLPYPIEYGAIPQTWDEDEDLLDVMCLVTYPTFPYCLLSVRPIGVMLFNDTGEKDDKILAVPVDDIRFKHIKSIDDIPEHQKDEIGFFFERYKDLQFKYKGQTDKEVKLEAWEGKEKSFEIIEEAQKLFKERFEDMDDLCCEDCDCKCCK
ncbi:inorganic pyrophosphatase [Candidatus Dojkabacteria bacterium]|nr:inorganic pyrophosphatase [Candidatus Dojkabacteria bacterium]